MGRRIRKMTMEEATSVVSRVKHDAIFCIRCPHFKFNWCGIFAKHVGNRNLACRYGHVLINAAKQAEKRKGAKK